MEVKSRPIIWSIVGIIALIVVSTIATLYFST